MRHADWTVRHLSLLTDDITVGRENPKESAEKLQELVSEFNKVAGYKDVWITKSTVILYTAVNNWILKLKNIPSMAAHIHTKDRDRQTYLGINLIKYVRDFYAKNYEMVVKKIKDQQMEMYK